MKNRYIFFIYIFLQCNTFIYAQSDRTDIQTLLTGKWELTNVEINEKDTFERKGLKEIYSFLSNGKFHRELLFKDSSYTNLDGKYKLNEKKKLIICFIDTVTFIIKPPHNFKVNVKLKKASLFRRNTRTIRSPNGFYFIDKKMKFYVAKLTEEELLIGKKGEDHTYLKYKKVK